MITMKNLIPLLSIALSSVCLQNCTNRDEDLIRDNIQLDEDRSTSLMKKDSAKSSEEILDPDPPVRDGDNWRIIIDN
jgi:hypothetical protein